MKNKKPINNGKLWLKKETSPYRGHIIFLTCLTVIATLVSLVFAYLVGYVINSAIDSQENKLWIFSAILLALVLLKISLKTFDSYYAEKLRAKITANLRSRIFSKILRSDYKSISTYHSGDLINRLTTDIFEVSTDTVGFLPAIVGMSVQCVGSIVALLTIEPLFTGIYVVCGIIFAAIAILFRKHIKKHHKAVIQADGEHRSFMQESIVSAMTIKAYSAEGESEIKCSHFAQNYYNKRMKRNTLRTGMSAIFTLLSNSGLIFAIVWCGASVLYGKNDDFGSILSIVLLLMQFQQPLTGFSSIAPAYYARLASGERLAEIDEIPCEEITTTNKPSIPYEDLSSITLSNVSFSYGRDTVLSDVNTEIEKGDIVCLLGASGSGKSTLFKLLLNIFTPTTGEINIYDVNKQQIPLSVKERSLFAYVPQGNFLFSGTIYENLTFFSSKNQENSVDEKIQFALKTACAEFVYDLPEGLQTILTERGGGLSEGQMQRLAIARAILSERPILLLDEATSALDPETEKKLLENIKSLANKTCLIVTHRPAAIAIADKVFEASDGKLIKKNKNELN